MKFWTTTDDTHSPYDIKPGVFTVPTTGLYHISASAVRLIPTGRVYWAKNPNRRWWQIWKPEFVATKEYERTENRSGFETRFLKVGETINTNVAVRA